MENTSHPSSEPVEKTWMPPTAGILCIIAGAIDLILGITLAAVSETVGMMAGFWGLGAIGTPLIILGIVAIVGGSFALQRKVWGVALAGAICALIWPLSLLGLLAIIFTAISKKEFG